MPLRRIQRWTAPRIAGLRARCLRRVLRHHCPQCGLGALFDRWAHLRERCNHCGLIYRREDGAELGSMYLSATVSQLFAAAVFLLLWLFTDWTPWVGFAVGAPVVLVFCYGFLPLSMALWTAVEYLTDVASGEWWAKPR
jgi:uncharacterized protein (DUF983 family)